MAPSTGGQTRSQKKTDAILQACHKGDARKLQQIIKTMKASEIEEFEVEEQLVHICAQSGSVDCLKLIIKTFDIDLIELNSVNSAGQTPLHLAVISENSQRIIEYLIGLGVDVNLPDNEGHSPLYCAVANGNPKLVDLLLKSGGDASQNDMFGASVVHYATQMCSNDNSDAAKILSQLLVTVESASLDQQDCDGRTPLVWAGSVGSPTAVKLLTEANADAMIPDNDGLTVLHCSSSNGYSEIIEILASYNPELVHVKDRFGCTPLFYAATHNHLSAIRGLINHGADPNHQDNKGRSVVHCAAERGNVEALSELENSGANVWLRSNKGESPLQEALKSDKSNAALQLLTNTNKEGMESGEEQSSTTLRLACEMGNLLVLRNLLDDGGTDVNCVTTSSEGKKMSPLDICEEKGHTDCAELIQSFGGRRLQPDSNQSTKPAIQATSQKKYGQAVKDTAVKKQKTPSDKTKSQKSVTERNAERQPAKSNKAPNSKSTENNQTKPQLTKQQSQDGKISKSSESKICKGQSKTSPPKQAAKVRKIAAPAKQSNSPSKTNKKPTSKAQTEQTSNSIAVKSSADQLLPDQSRSTDSIVESEDTGRSIDTGDATEDRSNKSTVSSPVMVDRGTEATHIKSSHNKQPVQSSTSLYGQSHIPYSNSWSLPYIDVSLHIRYPKNKTMSGSERAKSAATSRRRRITDSVNNYEKIRKSARSLQDQYLKTRPKTQHYQSSSRASISPSISTLDVESGNQSTPDYRVIATRGGFTKIRLTPPTSLKKQQAIKRLRDSYGNGVLYIFDADSEIPGRVGLHAAQDLSHQSRYSRRSHS